MPSTLSNSSNRASGSRIGRSHLFMKGENRDAAPKRQTPKSLRVCGLDPHLAASTDHDHRVHRGEHPIRILGKVLVARGVEQIDLGNCGSRNCRTVLETEMPRCLSSSIQSLVVARAFFLAVTDPANCTAPPYNRSFSVRVVFPASGCEMMAKVRRLWISAIARKRAGYSGKSCEDASSCTRWASHLPLSPPTT